MKRTIFSLLSLFVIVMLTVPVSAQKKYLVLGGDPQELGLQPIPGVEEVFVSNEDLCDSGWGTGSGKKVSGCYRKGIAAIRNIKTRIIVAIYFCGNRPSDQHIGIGKAVPREVVEKEVARYLTDPNAATKEDVGRLHVAIEEISSKLDNLATKDDVLKAINAVKGRPLCGESWRTGRRWGCAAVVVIVVGGTVALLSDDDDSGEQVTTLPPSPLRGPSTLAMVRQPVMRTAPGAMKGGMTLIRW
ncbi:MAG: hypothetical protein M3M85_01485 [bacterium]|nr:hypothetical protein [bacterium]